MSAQHEDANPWLHHRLAELPKDVAGSKHCRVTMLWKSTRMGEATGVGWGRGTHLAEPRL